MTASGVETTAADDGIDLVAAWRILWGYRILIIVFGLLGGIVGVVLGLLAVPIFRAEAMVTQVQDHNMTGGAASLVNQFGGLASLAGVNVGSTNQDAEYLAVLKSRHLVEEFIQRNNLLPTLFVTAKKPPTLWRGVERFRSSVLAIKEDKRNGTTTVAIDWKDPAVAAKWANDFVALANETLRTRALTESKRNIGYLNEQLGHTNVVEIQRVMYNLIENETKTLMMANGRPEYAFTVVDPAVAPELRISPRRTLMALVGGVIGGFAGILIALLHSGLRRQRAAAASNGT